jgi:hypothetical protein
MNSNFRDVDRNARYLFPESLDGTKIHANASKHSALSYECACKLAEKLREEVVKLIKMAEEADNTPMPDAAAKQM